jgi:hypothetical protein
MQLNPYFLFNGNCSEARTTMPFSRRSGRQVLGCASIASAFRGWSTANNLNIWPRSGGVNWRRN